MGRALGEDEVQCAATPTGLFVSLDGEDATGFRAVGAPLRFDQAAAVSRIVDAVLARDLRSRRGGASGWTRSWPRRRCCRAGRSPRG